MEWIDKAPKVKLYREPKRRVRRITPEQARTLLEELQEHQRDMVLFALATVTVMVLAGLYFETLDVAERRRGQARLFFLG